MTQRLLVQIQPLRSATTIAYISKTPKPPYYAVVFTSINANVDHTEHVEMYGRLVQRASTYDGYLGIEAAHSPLTFQSSNPPSLS
jgi:hypothetical protein